MASRRHRPGSVSAGVSDSATLHSSPHSVSPFAKVGGLLSGALLVGALALTPKGATAQERKADPAAKKSVPTLVAKNDTGPVTGKDGKPVFLAQNPTGKRLQAGSASGAKPLPPELAGLETVTLEDVQQLTQLTSLSGYVNATNENLAYGIDFIRDGKPARLLVVESIGVRELADLAAYSVVTTDPNNPSKKLIIEIGITNFDKLKELYKLATKQDLAHVKIFMSTGQTNDPKLGFKIEVDIVPVRDANAGIETGVPLVYVTYYSVPNRVTVDHYQFITAQ